MADMELTADIQYAYPQGCLRVNLRVPIKPTQVIVLFGPSGSGKSSLLHLLAGIKNPTSGTIQFGTEVWFDQERGVGVPTHRRSVGFLFQDYPLFPHLNVSENIAYGLGHLTRGDQQKEVAQWISHLRLKGQENSDPRALSGGERQRVALAQTLAPRPRLLLLDEPFSALDHPTRSYLRKMLREWLVALEIPTVLVTHDPSEALFMGDGLMVFSKGEILQRGRTTEVMRRPASAIVAQILGVENLLTGRVVDVQGEIVALDVDSIRLVAVGKAEVGQTCFISIRSEDILLERGESAQLSARNLLSCRIVELMPMNSQARVMLDCGFMLTAQVTWSAVEALGLCPGMAVTAVMKASSIHLMNEATDDFTV